MLKNHIFLTLELAKRDFLGRYAGSSLGIFWAFLQPILQLLLFTFVFSTVLKISLAGERGIVSFPLFLFAGLLPWMGVQEMLVRSTSILVDQSALIKKLAFPPQLLVASILLSALMHEAIAALIFMLILAFVSGLKWTFLLFPALLILQALLAAGLCFLFSGLQVFFRDTAQAVSYLVMIWFYATPIVYPLSLIKDASLLRLLGLNPMTHLIEASRDVLLRGEVPPPAAMAFLFAGGLMVTYACFVLFRHWRRQFPDFV